MPTYPTEVADFDTAAWVKVFLPFVVVTAAVVGARLTLKNDFGITQYTRLNKNVITVVWLLLSFCIGFSWAFSGNDQRNLIFFIIILFCIAIWVPVFNMNPLYSYYLIYVLATCSSLVWAEGPVISAFFIIPFLTWLGLSASFNYFVVLEQARIINSVPKI